MFVKKIFRKILTTGLKTNFMITMSKKVQRYGLEKTFFLGKKAVLYFFLFYLIRDSILYIVIPIMFAYLMESK